MSSTASSPSARSVKLHDVSAGTYTKQASLIVNFLIIGAGLAGLACAVALRRVGHRVVVLEKNAAISGQSSGGMRMPPNLTKILYHWGLRRELHSIALNSEGVSMLLCETGEVLGTHIWAEELLEETEGDFLFVHHGDFRELLFNAALSHGADVRLDVQVASIDPDNRAVILEGGEILTGDVIIGADGTAGLSRRLFPSEKPFDSNINLFSTTVPKTLVMEDPDLSLLYDIPYTSLFSWFGDSYLTLAFPLGGTAELAVLVYSPPDGCDGTWTNEAPREAMERALKSGEPRLQKLARLASPPVCIPVIDYPDLEQWVHEGGRMLLVGQAAHPLPPASIQESAMAIEDGAVLAKLFSHLSNEDQISTFLYAFQDLRQKRCEAAIRKEFGDIHYMTLPPGETQEFRDQSLRAKRDAGLGAFDAAGELELNPLWEDIKEMFGYNAEDEADGWWNDWGLLRERSKGREIPGGVLNQIMITYSCQTSPETARRVDLYSHI